MTPEERDELERQAGEYALGTLPDDERSRFEARLAHDAELCALVDQWDRRLGVLSQALAPVEPPATLWPRIQRALAPRRAERAIASKARAASSRPFWSSLLLWRGLAGAGLAAALALALVFAFVPREAAEGPRYVALLQDESAQPVFQVSLDAASGRLDARPLIAHSAGARVHELWLIVGDQPPRSLGVLALESLTSRALPASVLDQLAELAVLAISLEPPGGSPTGQPTGPVILKGLLART